MDAEAPGQQIGDGPARDSAAPMAEPAAPLAESQRVTLLDTLRGVALLGILPMNIPTFALSFFAFMYPPLSEDFEGANLIAWVFNHIFFEMKMMTIFSILFGAGVVLMTLRLSRRGSAAGPIFFRRTMWLAFFGLLHAYLLWYGDILFAYALCGMIVYLLRRVGARWLIVIALALMVVPSVLNVGLGLLTLELRSQSQEAAAGIMAGDQADSHPAMEAWHDMRSSFYPTADQMAAERTARAGGYLDYVAMNAPHALGMQTFLFLIWGVWRITGAMLLGAALLKLGVLTGKLSTRAYAALAIGGLGIGLPLAAAGAALAIHDHFDIAMHFLRNSQFNYWASVPAGVGYIALIALVARLAVNSRVLAAISAVGRMALTNYLAQSIICCVLFTGWGLGLWDRYSRAELWLFVGAIWAVQIVVSVLWLRWFRFGPAEWIWRSLTYWKLQPLRA